MSNEVEDFETVDERLLLVHLATDLYATRGSDNLLMNIPPCSGGPLVAKTVVIQLNPNSYTEALETDLILKVIETAKLGPLRITFDIPQQGCIFVPELGTELPLATGVTVKQCKENIIQC